MGRGIAFMAVSAGLVLVVAACATTRTDPRATSPASGVSGYEWDVSTISDTQHTWQYPATTVPEPPSLVFRPDGDLEGSDGLNYLSQGHYRLTITGYDVSGDIASTAEGTSRPDGALNAAQQAIYDAMQSGRGVHAKTSGTTLTVEAGGYTITLRRAAAAGIQPRPSMT